MGFDKKYNLEYNRERKRKEFWIDTNGKTHKLKGDLTKEITSIHYQIAKSLFPELEYPDDHLMKLGWILVGSSVYSCPIINAKPTRKQLNKLFELELYTRLCFKYKESYPNYDKYKALCD